MGRKKSNKGGHDGEEKDAARSGPGRPPKDVTTVPPYEPSGTRGPRTTLEEDMIPVIAQDIARGFSRAAAAASVHSTVDALNQWLQRGKRDVVEGKSTVYAHLLVEVNAAARHYEGYLLELANRAAQDKTLNVRWPTWRLGFLRPSEFTERALEGPGASNGFALMSPEEAVASVHQLMADFLARGEADTPEPSTEGAAPAPSSEPSGGR